MADFVLRPADLKLRVVVRSLNEDVELTDLAGPDAFSHSIQLEVGIEFLRVRMVEVTANHEMVHVCNLKLAVLLGNPGNASLDDLTDSFLFEPINLIVGFVNLFLETLDLLVFGFFLFHAEMI